MSSKARPARFRAAEALKRILDEGNETDTSLSSEGDSGSGYEDHVSQVSEQSDVECADVTTTQQPPPVNMQSSADGTAVPPTATNRGRSHGRGRGQGRGRATPTDRNVGSPAVSPANVVLSRKNGFSWSSEPPPSGRRREQDIIRSPAGITSAGHVNSILEAYHLYLTPEIVDNIVLQTNREARRRIREWSEQNPDKQRTDWKPVTAQEIIALAGLCILAGVCRSNHEPQSCLWSEREGRPEFIATMTRTRYREILKYMRFDDKATRQDREKNDSLAAFRDIWGMFVAQLPKLFIPCTDLCVDEQLVGFRGKCGFRQYILPNHRNTVS